MYVYHHTECFKKYVLLKLSHLVLFFNVIKRLRKTEFYFTCPNTANARTSAGVSQVSTTAVTAPSLPPPGPSGPKPQSGAADAEQARAPERGAQARCLLYNTILTGNKFRLKSVMKHHLCAATILTNPPRQCPLNRRSLNLEGYASLLSINAR